ncbi:hypothetical protein BpHYR1_018786 [Brachionus plicatilis]|uniref:Uncharacterized protein n=1 Tax=Brachionus plicatilis TaxID=10195 RepID=A0A3M7SJR0_BRAPC|nr:hypothetical protein BpHYR1_018786 [Brachionus plicatilis]
MTLLNIYDCPWTIVREGYKTRIFFLLSWSTVHVKKNSDLTFQNFKGFYICNLNSYYFLNS